MPERVTRQLIAVLEVLLSDPSREWYGLELLEAAGLSSGTLYPALHRLVADGWLVRTRDAASDRGGAGRRLYKLTGLGERAGATLLAQRDRRRRAAAPSPGLGIEPA